ncbi:MAG: CotH kinase family protein [Bacteroidales bacterium]|nr:CotH kinase family protein [Bacteroidales bacterium]
MKYFRILVAAMILLTACGKPAPVPAGEKPVSADPSLSPSADPSEDNSAEPSQTGSEDPSAEPSQDPSEEPSVDFSIDPDPNPHKLVGNIIGSLKSVDYDTGEASVTKNTKDMVFDGKYDTFFASYDRSRTWVGLDLGARHIITRVGYSPRISQEGRVELALLEGANSPDFSDALPLVLIKEKGRSNVMQYLPVDCSRGFRYVRYVGPNNARCNLAELEFYGYMGDGDDSRLYQLTNLPTVVINTGGGAAITSKTTEIPSTVYIISDGGTKLLATTQTGVRGRGNASWDFPKKPYRIKFAQKQQPLGAPAKAKKWTLINNYGDKTLMRNILAFEVSRRVGMAYTPFCTPVDVILNGEYQGCYQLCDQVEVGTGRVPAKDGYLVEIDAYASGEDVWFTSGKGMPVTIKYPKDDEITSEQRAFIKTFFNSMENAVFAAHFKDATIGYRKYLDVDSFLRNFLVGEFAGNTDTYWSVNMYKDGDQGVFYTGPAWDYDLSFENDGRTYPINNLDDYIYAWAGSVASDATRQMVNRIVKDDQAAKARLVELWDEAKPSLATLNDYVDETAALLDESQRLNFKRWPILGEYVHQNPRVAGNYEGEVAYVKAYITARLARLDELIKR